ncbi:hypothetical protein [Nostoc sp.]|uniref:hypothetical protein n=1 Tax=Nostoc sp. TaxID=1180 RepID=UPI002FF9E309
MQSYLRNSLVGFNTYSTSSAPHLRKQSPSMETSPTTSRSRSQASRHPFSTRARIQTPDSAPNSPQRVSVKPPNYIRGI